MQSTPQYSVRGVRTHDTDCGWEATVTYRGETVVIYAGLESTEIDAVRCLRNACCGVDWDRSVCHRAGITYPIGPLITDPRIPGSRFG